MTIACPKCSSNAIKRNGFTRHGKQNHRCLDCGRQFSLEHESNYFFEVAAQHQENTTAGEKEIQVEILSI